jgi:low affinity Fe/Cu permease
MTSKSPFGTDSPLNEMMKRQREQSDLLKRALGPSFALQELTRLPTGLAAFEAVERSGILKTAAMMKDTRIGEVMAASEAYRLSRLSVLKDYATPSWMVALQKTGIGINRDPTGILATQRGLVGSTVADMVKLGGLFEANRSVLGKLMMDSSIGDQFRAMSQTLAPKLDILKTAAERARMIDMMTLRATAEAVATSSTVVMAEQVIEAQRILDAIGQTEDPTQSTDLVVAFMALMSAMFSMFGENTAKELRAIGAFALLSILLNFQTIYKEFSSQDLTPAEQKAHSEMVVHAKAIEEKLDEILAADEAAKNAYVGDYPRGELKRGAAIRREPQGKAQVLMRGDAGTAIAVKESRGKWRLVIYRDPLTDQLSEGWVYASAVELLDAP